MKLRNTASWFATVVAIISLMTASLGEAGQQRRASAQLGPYCVGGVGSLFDAIEPGSLSGDETAAILYLREEEKLARDVYMVLAERWQLPIFANIARAEQEHMDLVLRLIESYELADPITDNGVGSFTDPVLGGLFTEFTVRGDLSLIDALTVGATIEDMDLADLLVTIETAANEHLKLVAYNLAKGSRNHLRAFVRALAAQGVEYTPQYLDPEVFETVLAQEMERRTHYGADGEPVPACGVANGIFTGRRGPGHDGDGSGPGDGQCTGSADCDGTGPHGGGQDQGSGGNDDGEPGDCDGTGPHGGAQGHGNGN